MTWYALSLLSVFVLAVAELTQQHLLNLKKAFSEIESAVFTFFFQSILTLPLIFFFSLQGEFLGVFKQGIAGRFSAVILLAAVAMIFYFKSFKVRNISISTIFLSLSIIVSTVLGILFLHENVSTLKFAGIGLVLLAIIILNIKNTSLEKNHYYGLWAGAIFGVVYALDKSIIIYLHPLVYIFWTFLLVSVLGFFFRPGEVIAALREKKMRDFWPVILSGFAYFLFNIFTFYAYRLGGEVGKIDAINNSQVFLIILFEFFVFRNTESLLLKIISATLAAVGVYILGM